MATFKTRGIILKRRVFGEADRILTILTPGMGKIVAIAKGVRRPTSKLAGYLELFYEVDWIMAEGKTWQIITGAEVVNDSQNLRCDLTRTEQAGYIAKLIDKVILEGENNPKMYGLLSRSFAAITDTSTELVIRQFEWQMLVEIGNLPELHACCHCGEELNVDDLGLCTSKGGALCSACLKTESVHMPISKETLKVLRLFEQAPVILDSRLNVTSKVELELKRVTQAFLENTLESPVDLRKSELRNPNYQTNIKS